MDSNYFERSPHIAKKLNRVTDVSHSMPTGQTPDSGACWGSARLAGLATLALALSLPSVTAQAAPTVTQGCVLGQGETLTLKGSVSYFNLSSGGGGKEISISELPVIAPAATGDVTWETGKAVMFTYNGVGNLSTAVESLGQPITRNLSNLGPLNYLQITITKNQTPTSISLNNVSLGGESLGSFTKPVGTSGPTCWSVTGVDMAAGFTLSGALALSGSFGGGASSNVTISIGHLEVPDVVVLPADEAGPITSDVAVLPDPIYLNGTATVSATVDDSSTGGSLIADAEYSVDNGAWLPMSAKDGAFDGVAEDVEVSFDATSVGNHEVCVRGTDSAGNTGEPLCQSFLVTYKFDGFFSPVDNGLVNVAKAGQTIPIKWRLTDANNVPIAYGSSFSGMFSSENLCVGGQPTDAVEETTSGSSGLQYNGDGYWQFNWKTPKDYASKCRVLYMQYNSGATSPVVKFEFKK
ncbi:hypothetical protein LPB260_23135 [Pseudomonas sp. LPB0260]|uniref:PxKF domain-containing protein n=1 Tax=Pseudomonas sp. LPB0260 TaxID=2614442 RepID=UPI0015C227C9|nr:PxKF domain-containing protein [Pseudomonas sp. LPB0260]QLC73626.1 hypothetical protein LPB260_08185 [Pseudomonas sp. LPB0260]QLC76400.1 hypothetical protein LPB260_23135 [Pseudomonas sp. LPB0260]